MHDCVDRFSGTPVLEEGGRSNRPTAIAALLRHICKMSSQFPDQLDIHVWYAVDPSTGDVEGLGRPKFSIGCSDMV